jgi:hypothetical protein
MLFSARTRPWGHGKLKLAMLHIDIRHYQYSTPSAPEQQPLRYREGKRVLLLALTFFYPCEPVYDHTILRVSRRVRHESITPVATECVVTAGSKPTGKFVFQSEPEISVRENLMAVAHVIVESLGCPSKNVARQSKIRTQTPPAPG